MTGDLDIFIEISEKNASAMLEVLEAFGFSIAGIEPGFFMDKGEVVRLGHEPLKLEILNDISGISFAECYRNRVTASIEELKEEFTASKEAAKSLTGTPFILADKDIS